MRDVENSASVESVFGLLSGSTFPQYGSDPHETRAVGPRGGIFFALFWSWCSSLVSGTDADAFFFERCRSSLHAQVVLREDGK